MSLDLFNSLTSGPDRNSQVKLPPPTSAGESANLAAFLVGLDTSFTSQEQEAVPHPLKALSEVSDGAFDLSKAPPSLDLLGAPLAPTSGLSDLMDCHDSEASDREEALGQDNSSGP